MSTAARKARKRSGERFVKAQKTPTGRSGKVAGFGFVSGAEIMAAIVVADRLGKRWTR